MNHPLKLETLESHECTTASSDTGGMVLDIATVIELTPPEVADEIKHAIIKNRLPGKDFKFPPKQYNDRSEASGVKQRYCLREWFERYDTLCYSKSTDGVFCFCCTFFHLPAHHGKRANDLVSVHCRNWKNARADFSKHVNLEYHRDSKSKMDAFIQMMTTLSVGIQNRISQEMEKRV